MSQAETGFYALINGHNLKKDTAYRWIAMSFAPREEIAAEVDWPRQTIADWIKDFTDFARLSESGKTLASHADEKF